MYYWYLGGTDKNAVTFPAQVQPSTTTTALNVMIPEMRDSVIQGTILLNYSSNKALHYRINSPR